MFVRAVAVLGKVGTTSGHLGGRSFLLEEIFFNAHGTRTFFAMLLQQSQVGWPNGKALDYESRDCRFDPCVDQHPSSFHLKEFPFCSFCMHHTTMMCKTLMVSHEPPEGSVMEQHGFWTASPQCFAKVARPGHCFVHFSILEAERVGVDRLIRVGCSELNTTIVKI